jgi:hypothetical protein
MTTLTVQTENTNVEFQDETTGLTFEHVTLTLPKNIVDFYRVLAYFRNQEETTFIADELIKHLETKIDHLTPCETKNLFNLTRVFKTLKNKSETT